MNETTQSAVPSSKGMSITGGAEYNMIIYGGCATRDAFTKDVLKSHNITIQKYLSRSILPSLVGDAFEFPVDVSHLPPFKKRIILEDASKEVLRCIRDAERETPILCDFVSSVRFDLYRLSECRFGTLTPEVRSLLNKSSVPYEVINRDSDEYSRLQDKGIEIFIDSCMRQVSDKRFFVNRIYSAEKYSNGEEVEKNLRDVWNKKLKNLYAKIELLTGPEVFIDYEPRSLVADVDHQWGKLPVHFVTGFYEFQINELMARLESRRLE